jgi:two-component sensor histidine kinase
MRGVMPYLIALLTASFLLILAFQIFWLRQSRQTIEDQFNQKVSMALCTAVEGLDGCSPGNCTLEAEGFKTFFEDGKLSFQGDCIHLNQIDTLALSQTVEEALRFYDLPEQFEMSILQEEDPACKPESPFCCAIGPFSAGSNQYISIDFPGRSDYILSRMWMPLISTVLLLTFVFLVFIFTIHSLLKQRRIAQFNKDFFNNMAHEFRTPLTNVKLALNRLKQKNKSLADDSLIHIVQDENEKLNRNVERVLALAKLDNDQYELKLERVGVRKLLDSVVHDLEELIHNSKAKIEVSDQIDHLFIWADPLHLSHAFRNLIENAIKYCDDIPEITIGLKKTNEGVMLIFEDNGIGIPDHQKKMVFVRFC